MEELGGLHFCNFVDDVPSVDGEIRAVFTAMVALGAISLLGNHTTLLCGAPEIKPGVVQVLFHLETGGVKQPLASFVW